MQRPSLILALALCLSLVGPALSQQPDPDVTVATLNKEIPALMDQADIPGLSIAVLNNGRSTWVHNFGYIDPTKHEPITDDTTFNIASLSKTVFAYAVLKLVDQGKLNLDTPLTHYWPERIVDDPRLDRITARIVLSHRTGFRNWRPDGGKLQIYFTPGERFSYSGEGIVYLSHVIEHIEGKPFNDIMQQLVFTPLHMTHSSYVWHPETQPNATPGYSIDGRAFPAPRTTRSNAASSLTTTTHDYALFLEAILNNRGLKPSTLRQMETPQIAVDPTCTNCTDHAPVRLSTDLFWGLGWGIEQNSTGKYLWHWGDNGVYKAFVVADPNRRRAIVYFANSENGLSIAPAIVHTAMGGDHPSFSWLKYDTYDSIAMRFTHEVVHNGVDKAMQDYASDIDSGAVPEHTLNGLGYFLLSQKNYPQAITVFIRDTRVHPTSANAWDSLGEAYMRAGQNDLAIQSYEKALQLDPTSSSAKNALAKLNDVKAKNETTH